MANHKATKKDVRQASKRRDRNRYYGKTTRNAIRDLKANKEKKEVEMVRDPHHLHFILNFIKDNKSKPSLP